MVRNFLSMGIMLLAALSCFGQEQRVKIGILSRNMDTTFTHVYVDMVRSMNKLNPFPFNLMEYYKENLREALPDPGFLFTEVEWQTLYNKFNFYNINGGPSKKCKVWMNTIYQQDSLDYILFLDAKNILSSSHYSGIKSNSYGIATFDQNAKLICLYAMVYPRLYSLNPVKEVEIKRSNIPYLLNNIVLAPEEKLKRSEIETLTDGYYSMALDSIKYYTNEQIKVISSKLNKEIIK